jgi:hypothetical protein
MDNDDDDAHVFSQVASLFGLDEETVPVDDERKQTRRIRRRKRRNKKRRLSPAHAQFLRIINGAVASWVALASMPTTAT